MNAVSSSDRTLSFSWADIWAQMKESERIQAVETFATRLREGPPDYVRGYGLRFQQRLAKRLHFRPQTVQRMNPQQLASAVLRIVDAQLEYIDWVFLFQAHYLGNKCSLMCEFLDLCGIPHDEHGGTTSDIKPPEDIEKIAQELIAKHGKEEAGRYFMVLRLQQPELWGFLDQVLSDHIAPVSPQLQEQPVSSAGGETGETLEMSQEFTQLDRVLIEQIVATAGEEERALSPDEIVDLIETVHALDTGRNRTYFHLGFMDALLVTRVPDFDRPEINDGRREWYLAGLLAGFSRQRNLGEVERWLDSRRSDFERAARSTGGAGTTMAKTLLGVLLDSEMIAPAVTLLKHQIVSAGPATRWRALSSASDRLRQDDTPAAKALLTVLHEKLHEIPFQDSEERADFHARVQRKLGQAFQSSGELTKARALFQELLDAGPFCTPEMLVDLGLVEAGFSALREVRAEGDSERRAVVRKALDKGNARFSEAVERFEDGAVQAHYVLAVKKYLEYMDSGTSEEVLREAMTHAESALAGMIGSDLNAAYMRLGIMGQCRFVLAVLRAATLDPAHGPAIQREWESIGGDAGRFPREHLERFLEWTELMDQSIAVRIAESIWRKRGEEALDLLKKGAFLDASEYLRTEMLKAARDGARPRIKRYELWEDLVPSLIRVGSRDAAEEGLDVMEGLALEDSDIASRFSEWLLDTTNHDPFWDECDVLRVRYQLYSRLGKEAETLDSLRRLFFALRDRNPQEAQEIRDLFAARQAPPSSYEDLIVPLVDPALDETANHDSEQRLRLGEEVKVLLIGGNETQAQYDDAIRTAIGRDWPGVKIDFEHTGWSSNWGREFGQLRKKAADANVVVLMSMIRTMLGRNIRAALNDPPRPWVSCHGKGRKALERSIRKAAVIGLR